MKILMTILLATLVSAPSFDQLTKKTNIVRVNDIDMYFEIYGEGEPLLLLHGWTQSSAFWKDYIPTYAQNFQVYVIDLRGHGRTSPIAMTLP